MQPSGFKNSSQTTTIMSDDPYHVSVAGSILLPLPTDCPKKIFSYLRHGQFDKFRCCLYRHHKEIIQMTNEHGQSVLHILTIYAYPYHWIRLLLMQGSDPCCQDNDGYTPVQYAIERDDIEMLKALTMPINPEIKALSEEKINDIHQNCLKALSKKQQEGLTAFMLCCRYQSIKCLTYLFDLNINDVNLQDNFGDTCLHYAVACRNEILVDKLINQYQADVNSGANHRPSVLDILQFNREQQKPYDRIKDDSIERILLSHKAVNRCQIKRIFNKRKTPDDQEETAVSNLACLTDDSSVNSQLQTAKNYAQLAISSENNGHISNTKEYYERARNSIPNDSIDWSDYTYNLALIHIATGDNKLALDLLQQALTVRSQFEKDTVELDKIQHAIGTLEKKDLI